MSFDEHLRRALGSLADRLQEETKRQLATISDELGDAFDTERTAAVDRAVADAKAAGDENAKGQLAAAVAAAEARSNEALTNAQNEAREAGRIEGLEAGRQQGREEGLEEGRANGIEIGRKQGRQEGREEGLEEGRQEGLELGRQEVGKGRQEGREQALAELRAGELAANERLIAAVRAIDGGKSLSEILDTLASAAGREARRASMLVIRGGQLRGWRFIGFGALDDRHDLDVPVAGAGVVAEAARTGVAVSTDSSASSSVPSFAELPPGREMLAVPVSMSGQVVAVLYADQGPAPVNDAELRVGWPATLEVMARHAARCLEATTAFRAAQILTERPDVRGARPEGNKRPASAASETEDADQAARRYARLLVSEIKMYHEAAVVAGRRDGDLASRLGGEIARARALYEQRVPAEGRKGKDHFHDELVRTLADGNAALLELKK